MAERFKDFNDDAHDILDGQIELSVELSDEDKERIVHAISESAIYHFMAIDEVAEITVEARIDELRQLRIAMVDLAIRHADNDAFKAIQHYIRAHYIPARRRTVKEVALRESQEEEDYTCDFCGCAFWTHEPKCPVLNNKEPVYNKWGRCYTCGAYKEKPSHMPDCKLNKDTSSGD